MKNVRDCAFSGNWTIREARVLDPLSGEDCVKDIFCRDGVFCAHGAPDAPDIDGSGLIVMPPAVDLHVHFREPGGERAETVSSGLAAARRGGFGAVVVMPNTLPPLDTPERVKRQFELAAATGEKVRLYVAACCTKGRAGKDVAPLEALARAGAVAFSDDGAMVADSEVMTEVMQKAAALGIPVMDHAVVPEKQGTVRNCRAAQALGLKIFPDEAETAAVERDIALARKTGAHIHLQHLSCAASIGVVAEAKAAGGVAVSCEATPHHLLLAAEDIPGDDTSWKMNPPLGTRKDRAALREAVLDGTIDCFATDHAPHEAAAKARGFASAPFGCIGLETALAATWRAMVEESGMRPIDWAAKWTVAPAALAGLPPPSLETGAPARATVFSLRAWRPSESDLASKARNCPFLGMRFPIRVEALLA